MKIGSIFAIIFASIVSFVGVSYTNNQTENNIPIEGYRVYLDGKTIGLIESKDELENYIDTQQQKLKEKYHVDKIYIPNEIDIVKEITYDEKIDSISSIYNKINQISPFTIRGYQITIDKTNSTEYGNDDNEVDENKEKIIKVNVINKEIFEKAVESVILSFVDEDKYKAFIEDEQLKIETTGEVIENIYIEDKITIKETNISTKENIYMDVDSLTKYLIFGNNSSTETYKVKVGDNISEIAHDNNMSVNELLIANTNIKGENSLLYEGQVLSIGTLEPVFSTVVEKHVVEDQTVKFKTTTKYDNTKLKGYSKVTQQGINGVNRVTQKIKTINGEVSQAYIVSSDEVVPVVNKIVVKGGKEAARGDGQWEWPTNYPYIISSHYGWRWGKLHKGVDICGTGRGSPIYAARAGVIVNMTYHSSLGYYVVIKHDNGYYTQYAHMQNTAGNDKAGGTGSYTKYIKIGQRVSAKTVIGEMGNSGNSFGVHLHFEIWNGKPYQSQCFNPLSFY